MGKARSKEILLEQGGESSGVAGTLSSDSTSLYFQIAHSMYQDCHFPFRCSWNKSARTFSIAFETTRSYSSYNSEYCTRCSPSSFSFDSYNLLRDSEVILIQRQSVLCGYQHCLERLRSLLASAFSARKAESSALACLNSSFFSRTKSAAYGAQREDEIAAAKPVTKTQLRISDRKYKLSKENC